MIDHDTLHERTETYLKSLICDAADAALVFDAETPFGELGVNSFLVLKILKRLEQDFGTLPKTLLFENFNVRDLARYFVKAHTDVLLSKFPDVSPSAPAQAEPRLANAAAHLAPAQVNTARAATIPTGEAQLPAMVALNHLHRYPELEQRRREIFDRYKNESSVSRGTAMIAPLLFFGDAQHGYFNCGKGKGILLAYGYTGPAEHFPPLAEQLYQYCEAHSLQFNLFVEDRLPELCGKRFSATPFGVMQRVTNLPSFTLEGQKMKRLRYQVSKFANAGACRTEEFVCGSDAKTAKAVADIIDRWCATRTKVNPLIHIVKAEILAGTLDREHRLFLTYVDDVLQNAILVSPLAAGAGYLMDLEFYGPDMPLGGLEFAIVNIIQTLRDEGCSVFSLGGTYGCKLADSPDADPAIESILEDLRSQDIFNDAGNLQFKNKFRPESKDIFLCRAVDAGKADNVLDIILMIADPSIMDDELSTDDGALAPASAAAANAAPTSPGLPAPASTVATTVTFDIASNPRWKALEAAGFNPLNIPAEQVDFDLKTDSWAQLQLTAIDKQMALLFAQIQRPIDVNAGLRRVFPFKHFTLAESGRAAEALFCQVWEKKGRVPQNILFPSTIFHQIDNGFSPVELPVADVFDLQSDAPFKGNIDLSALRAEIAAHAADIGYVCIELADNAAGGGAVSLAHLREVKALLQAQRIPLVLDATRVLENALKVIEHDPEWHDASLWQVAEALLSQADVVMVSLAKDFCVNKGGLIASNDQALHDRLQALQQHGGKALDVTEKKCIAASLQNRAYLETQVRRRVDAVRALAMRLAERQVPVVRPASAHCVLIDVKRIPAFRDLLAPVASFAAWLYLATGIRAGAHSVGMQQNTSLNQLVRLAIPVGLKADEVKQLGDRLVNAFADIGNIPDLSAAEGVGDLNARLSLHRLLSPQRVAAAHTDKAQGSGAQPSQTKLQVSAPHAPEPDAAHSLQASAARESDTPMPIDMDIAIVGMAARLPKARNADELWENLSQGRDCISEIPQSRFERRRNRDVLGRYRGGFLDDLDRFDSLFFNISPREAETLDPQERLFLEVSWEVLEDAGYYPEALQSDELGGGRIGVYVGAVWAMYQMVGAEERLAGNKVIANSFLWSVANRVSYFMNFTGPSIAVDTACSASLTAIHLACDAIRNGECAAALVGGVNLDVHQCKQEITVAGGLLSEEGLCRAFGRNASGYVPGEGVGALLLKPLAQARRDRDNIYAVIKSSAISHGGRNSGYAVPNSKAQCEVIGAALKKAKVDARSIGYIEAHGTGTELGDPIEIAGLNQAFEKDQVALQSCAIGSIKTNIGHLEAAAGIAGVCKTLLQMRHRTLVPSLHSAQLNEFIDFAHSPFVVQQALAEWHPKEVDGVLQPLRAGVSSFGAGGANAHVILEAVDDSAKPGDRAPVGRGVRIFPLSARNEEQLRQVAMRLKSFLEKHRDHSSEPSLDEIAFTLQLGRKSFDHRVALLADSHERLIARLQCFLTGSRDEHILIGHVKNAEGITKMLSRSEKEAFIDLLAKSRDPIKLAQLWIDGLVSEWQGMQTGGQGRRISLPTYPFADKRHWLQPAEGRTPRLSNAGPMTAGQVAGLHPLIDSNESTFERQLFRKVFTDREFFIYDHLVSDIPTLPGVAYLDLARKAGEIAAGRKVRRIRNILWVSPLTVKNAVPNDVLVELKAAGDSVLFEVFSERDDGKKQLYCQGKLFYATAQDDTAEDQYVDLSAIRARCEKVMEGERAYPLFKELGLGLGPSFQALTEVHRNPQVGFEVLGALKMPALDGTRFDEFVLHPSLVDSSFQAAMAARLADAGGEMFVPYSLGEVEILHPLTQVCYSYVTESKDEKKSSNVSKMDVLIVDEQGKVLVKVRDSVGVPLLDVHEKPGAASKAAPAGEGDAAFSTLYFGTDWQPSPLAASAGEPSRQTIVLFAPDETSHDAYRAALAASGGDPDRLIAVLPGDGFARVDAHRYCIDAGKREDFDTLLSALRQQSDTKLQVCFAWSAQPDTDANALSVEDATMQALERGVYAFLFLTQAVIAQKCEADVRLQYLYFSSSPVAQPHNEAIQGFATILRAESPKLACKVVEIVGADSSVESHFDQASVAAIAAEFGDDSKALAVRYREGVRYLRRIHDCPEPSAPIQGSAPIRHRGIYLITGGAGGLGLMFAEHLSKQFQARLVLSGRAALKPEAEAALESMRAAGAEVVYVAADVSRREDVERLVRVCKDSFGGLHGIIHSAGVLRDAYLRNKTREEMAAVFAPKIRGSVLLDDATRNEPLDFFVMFSSLAALAGNAGQSDYSFANHFMDAFAAQRNALARAGQRHGKALSLNWSIWAEGGMRLDEQTALFFERNLGIRPLQSEVGIQALMLGLHSDLPHLAVLQGVKDKVERAWGIGEPDAPAVAGSAAEPAAVAGEDADLALQVQDALSQIVMDFLKIDADDVDLDTILLDLGFDSIGLTSFSNMVNDKYGLDITPVLFFEYPNIREIAKHLARDHRENMLRVHGQVSTASSAANAGSSGAAPAAETVRNQPLFASKNTLLAPALAEPNASAPAGTGRFSPGRRFIERPIAIVGMSGVMPQADTLDEYWDKLSRAENNMVTLVPPDRWDWEAYYGNPMAEKNKTLSKWGGFMREVDKFDPLFWGISPREAEMMDPQQRIFLESVWGAIEDSGHRVSDLAGTKTGLFVGAATRDYIDLMATYQAELDGYSASGTSHAILVNRVSFLLNLHGPSAPLDTACSSSLVALHRAIESIHTGSCDMAIVGGVQVMLTPAGHISFGAAGMLADDGKCKTFDSRANGYVRGEGSGAILIKPLENAIADGDHIYAVVKSTAENHGGKVTMLTAPNPNAQAELLVEAYEKAEIDPRSVGYLECHGTGTSLGDPIEIQAMKKAFSELYHKHQLPPPATPHIGLTSAKTNIGHLETAAGIAGILKVLLSIKHKQIPALLHFEKLNPYINLDNTPFYPVAKTQAWAPAVDEQGRAYPRRAGISSFGFGGANVHVVLEEYLEDDTVPRARPNGPYAIVLSAKNADRLRANASRLLAHLQSQPEQDIADVAYTLQVGRDPMPERMALVVASMQELIERLQAYVDGDADRSGVRQSSVRRKADIVNIDAATLDQWLRERDLTALIDVWLKGQEPDWRTLYKGYSMRRCALPTYAFARERYWFSIDPAKQKAANQSVMHPLLHRNVSVFGRQSFASDSAVLEKSLRGTALRPEAGLPGMLPVEMVRLALRESLGERGHTARIELRSLVWPGLEPAVQDGTVSADLYATGDNDFEFEVRASGVDGESMLCEGAGAYQAGVDLGRIDLSQLRSLFRGEVHRAADFYAALDAAGMLRDRLPDGVVACRRGERQQLLEFRLPRQPEGTVDAANALDGFALLTLSHLACLDHLAGGGAVPTATTLLALERVAFASIGAREGVIWVRSARGSGRNGDRAAKATEVIDIDVIDSEGRVLIKIKGLLVGYPETQGAHDEEFASMLDSLYAPGSPSFEHTTQRIASLEFEHALDAIFEEGET
ncbi:SDR family NAD(P)-dependent oxidoreductase [Pseudomarimonas arenosa]|uniref:SDR family NAD(P)-dependent oxidoreductase n=1 Tax=Pseudomarimonas arenosa TaxID=2774145 RepID=A0AAW3ZK55_9GAMM|nr:SDR family NAD(P)-dependent oxidoreductase [Pseudomarimonas arenosa]MBD8525904.1 SDR family NAD(P)-dependent oxidoreductase [Pseudomarimonas arenosa]